MFIALITISLVAFAGYVAVEARQEYLQEMCDDANERLTGCLTRYSREACEDLYLPEACKPRD